MAFGNFIGFAGVSLFSSTPTSFPKADRSRSEIKKCRACIVPRAFDVMILSVFHRTISCLHVDFRCFKLALMANFRNLRQEFMNFWSFLTCPGDKHDKGISSCSWTPRESHNFLTFLTTRLPISCFLGKYHFEMKCFFGWIKTEMFTDAESQLILLSLLQQRNCKLYNAVSRSLRDGFARHLISMS